MLANGSFVCYSDITLHFNVSAYKTVLYAETLKHPVIKLLLILLCTCSRSICLPVSPENEL